VVLDDSRQSRFVADLRDPAGQLRVPNSSVSTEELVVILGELCGLVGGAESELAAGALSGIPLHAIIDEHQHQTSKPWSGNIPVLRSDLTKVCLDDGGVLATIESAGVCGSTEVLATLLDHSSIDALGCLALIEDGLWLCVGSGRDERADGQDGSESELHDGRMV
jgi:hypothetical protein